MPEIWWMIGLSVLGAAGKGLQSTRFIQEGRVLSAGSTLGGLFVLLQLLVKCISLVRMLAGF
ncbi:MAG: hypothetical protein ABSC17_11485 [Thermacetogeniaceae bacterium]